MKYGRIWPHIIFVILVGVFVVLNNPDLISDKLNLSYPNAEADKTKETAQVLRVIDGDTIEVSLNGQKETVRLIGIDTPETADQRKTVQCFAEEASERAGEILNGKTVILESDPTQSNRDKYGRLLRYVFLSDLNFNKFMISEGLAHEYTYQNNSYKYQSVFIQAAKAAREGNRGLWQKCGGV